jgi:hypothetical protein
VQHLEALWPSLQRLAPFLALAALLAAMVVAINALGRRLERHGQWLDRLDVRVGNLDKDRKATWTRRMQVSPLVPPPLPTRAPTLNAADWQDDDLETEDLSTRATGRYPGGEPPKGPNDDDA